MTANPDGSAGVMGWIDRLRARSKRDGGFLARLARNRSGNTLAMMAAALIPLIGFSGSAVDMARLYVVKVRLQQACDAGVLAGRKTMTDTSISTPLDKDASDQAQAFFKNNFRSGWFQNTNPVFTPTKAMQGTSTVANAVYGTAEVSVPMALMQYFGLKAVPLKVSCQALYDMADADIMFVLDTTGSMSCYPTDPTTCATTVGSYPRSDGSTGYRNPEKPQTTYQGQPMYSKIESLRQAVMTFDTTMRTNADPSTHFRYGFVAYSSAVNVGDALMKLPTNYLQNTSWTYQSRHLSPVIGTGGVLPGDYGYGAATNVTLSGMTQQTCVEQRSPGTGFSKTGKTWSDQGYYQAARYYNLIWTSSNSTCSGKSQPLRPLWRYEPVTWNTAAYIASYGPAGKEVINPTKLDGDTSKWRGCIEEVDTKPQSSFSLSSLPDDLDPDFTPTSPSDKWRPMWQDVEWMRNSTSYQDVMDEQISEDYFTDTSWLSKAINSKIMYDYSYGNGHVPDQNNYTACGMPAQRLQTMTAQQVHDYVYNSDFQPSGGTYHDVGLIWGNRMLSPDGVFKADTAAWPGRNDPTRTIVFMTDGNMAPNQYVYGQYGVELYDNRIGSGGSASDQLARHTARFRIECDAAKKKGYTIYTIAVGLKGTAVPDLDYCSSQGAAYYADDTATLKDVFAAIAQRVAKLRISK